MGMSAPCADILLVDTAAGQAPRGRQPTPLPLRWRAKSAADSRAYGLNYWLVAPLGARLVQVAAGSDDPALRLLRRGWNGLAATIECAGGTPNRTARVSVLAIFSDGTRLARTAELPIVAGSAAAAARTVLGLRGVTLTAAGTSLSTRTSA